MTQTQTWVCQYCGSNNTLGHTCSSCKNVIGLLHNIFNNLNTKKGMNNQEIKHLLKENFPQFFS